MNWWLISDWLCLALCSIFRNFKSLKTNSNVGSKCSLLLLMKNCLKINLSILFFKKLIYLLSIYTLKYYKISCLCLSCPGSIQIDFFPEFRISFFSLFKMLNNYIINHSSLVIKCEFDFTLQWLRETWTLWNAIFSMFCEFKFLRITN